jgi:hypothetical protein
MFTIRLLPLFAIGCASLPNDPGEIKTQLDPTSQDDSFHTQDFDAMAEDEIRAVIWEQVMALDGLEIVQVGDVILDLPAEALCAYGWTPCPGFEEEVSDALRDVAPRLETLTHFAKRAVDEDLESRDTRCVDHVIDWNLDQLADLEIVTVGELIRQEPEQITCERAETLDRIVALAEGL